MGNLLYEIKCAVYDLSMAMDTTDSDLPHCRSFVNNASKSIKKLALHWDYSFPAAAAAAVENTDVQNAFGLFVQALNEMLPVVEGHVESMERKDWVPSTEPLLFEGEIVALVKTTYRNEWHVLNPVTEALLGVVVEQPVDDYRGSIFLSKYRSQDTFMGRQFMSRSTAIVHLAATVDLP